MNDERTTLRTPWWAFAIILALALLEPVTHAWIATAAFEDRVPTGLHTPDSAVFIQSMRMFSSGFHSSYATCRADSPNDLAYFPLPFHWMYGIVGAIADVFGADHLIFLGIVNGLGLAAYLYAVFRFLSAAVPAVARLAFVVYTCTGGLGGVLYWISRVTGIDHGVDFETYFQRFAMYELVEGPYLFPWLYGPRLYYTLSLACCFAALTAYLDAIRMRCGGHHLYAAILLFAGTLINFRFGMMAFGLVVLLEIASHGRFDVRQSWRMGVATGIATAMSYLLMATNPAFLSNTSDLVRETMWLTPFVTATAFHLPLLAIALVPVLRVLRGWPRALALLGVAYVFAFTVLFLGYQLYFGNLLVARDGAAAVRISDWALGVAVAGCVPMFVLRREWFDTRTPDTAHLTLPAWFALWFVGYFAIAVSAFGQGWFAQFTPQRFMVFLGVPLAVFVAQGFGALRRWYPAIARAWLAVLLFCGAASISAAALLFQGPFSGPLEETPFLERHAEWMTVADAELLNTTPQGTVLAPARMADAVAVRPGLSTLGGAGGADHSDVRSVDLQPQIDRFFATTATDDERTAFLEWWCIDYVFCPDTWPVDPPVIVELEAHPLLDRVHSAGRGAVFRVVK